MLKKYFSKKDKTSVRQSRAGFFSREKRIDVHLRTDACHFFSSFSRDSLAAWKFEIIEKDDKFQIILPTVPENHSISFESRKSADDFMKMMADSLSPNYLLKAVKVAVVIYILLNIPYGNYQEKAVSSVAPAAFTSLSDVGLGSSNSDSKIISRTVGPDSTGSTDSDAGPVSSATPGNAVEEITVDVNDPFGLRLGSK